MAASPTQPGGHGHTPGSDESERVPVMQMVLDNPFLLLFIGIAVPTVFYLLWGIMDIVMIPIAK